MRDMADIDGNATPTDPVSEISTTSVDVNHVL